MSNVLTIAKRELNAYFTSPIGYIVMIVFITVSVGLFTVPFFSFPVADMRPYFAGIPMMLAILIAAITMRSWAQERSENTWEMLLTFPMKAWELVIGKFVASLVFFLLTLSATATIPIMLAQLGNPDGGVIFSSRDGWRRRKMMARSATSRTTVRRPLRNRPTRAPALTWDQIVRTVAATARAMIHDGGMTGSKIMRQPGVSVSARSRRGGRPRQGGRRGPRGGRGGRRGGRG